MKRLKRILEISPFWISILVVIIFTFFSWMHEFEVFNSKILTTMDQSYLDWKFNIRGPIKAKNKILIAAADDKSFQTFGQWPWDRKEVFAKLIDRLCKYNPKAIAIDIVWSEHETIIREDIANAIIPKLAGGAEELNQILMTTRADPVLGQSIKNCLPKMVLGYQLENYNTDLLPEEEFKKRLNSIFSSGGNALTTIARGVVYPDTENGIAGNLKMNNYAINGLLNIPEIVPDGLAQGFFNNDGDSDGNYRYGLLVFRTPNGFLSSISLRTAQKVLSTNDNPPTFNLFVDESGSQDLSLVFDNTTINLNSIGQINVNYRGPNFSFPNLSISDIIDEHEEIEQKVFDHEIGDKTEKLSKSDLFKDSIVLIGSTASAAYDIRPRPLAKDAAGVENHATIIDNLLSKDFIEHPSPKLRATIQVVMFIFGILFSYLVFKLKAIPGMLITITTLFLIWYLDQKYLFEKNKYFSGHLQFIQITLQYLTIMTLKYWREESQKKEIRDAFDKFVSPAVINEMLADPSKLKIGGDKKNLTILFSDIRGFTTLSEKVDVKTLTSFLNEYLGAMTDILQSNQGTLDKYIGDAVMGFWSAPLDVPNHGEMAVKTAKEMIAKLSDLNAEFKVKYDLVIDIGIGIHTGPVSVGNFGSSKVFEYTVIGDNVNLASRLEGLTKHYGVRILISEATYLELDKSKHKIREIDLVKVKGKNKPVKVFEVIPEIPSYQNLLDVLGDYEKGLLSYYARNWDQAIVSFQQVLVKQPADKSSKDMIDRCEYYKQNQPSSDWDGSWEMHEK